MNDLWCTTDATQNELTATVEIERLLEESPGLIASVEVVRAIGLLTLDPPTVGAIALARRRVEGGDSGPSPTDADRVRFLKLLGCLPCSEISRAAPAPLSWPEPVVVRPSNKARAPAGAPEVHAIAQTAKYEPGAPAESAESADALLSRVLGQLPEAPGADALEAALRALAEAVRGADGIRRVAIRGGAVRLLNERKVQGAAATVDAALGRAAPDAADDGRQGGAITFEAPEPWGEPVDGSVLLDEVEAAFRKHVVMPSWARRAVSLWVLHTWCFEAADFTPRVFFTSAEKGSGKTRALAVLCALAARVLATAGITAAALFRTVAAHRPTLAVDECDTFLRDNEELRGVLNAGFERGGAVVRCIGDDAEPRRFDCFAPVAMAGIGRLPGTIEDRSFVVPMQRRLPSEPVEPFRRPARAALADVRRRCARWAKDHVEALKTAQPAVPEALDDRAADILGPLLAIADLAGGEWPARARQAARDGLAGRRDDDTSWGVRLLGDIRAMFEARPGVDRIATDTLLEALVALDERPWADYRRGKPINARYLGALLKPYGVRSGNVRTEAGQAKGYALAAFENAFRRYLPTSDPSHRPNALEAANSKASRENACRPKNAGGTDAKSAVAPATQSPHGGSAKWDGGTDRKAENGGGNGTGTHPGLFGWCCPSCGGAVPWHDGDVRRCLRCDPPTEPLGPPTPSDALTDDECDAREREAIAWEGNGTEAEEL